MPTLTRYREVMHKTMGLKPSTINRRLITMKRFFELVKLGKTHSSQSIETSQIESRGKNKPKTDDRQIRSSVNRYSGA